MLPVRLAISALACVLALAPSSAKADDADALIKQGVELRRAGKDKESLEPFRRAYDLAPTPRALAQLALAEQALGRWVDAEEHLGRALETPQDPWIAKYRPTLDASRATISGHLGSLEVHGSEGAEVRVDGQLVGTLPLTRALRVPVGSALLEVSAHSRVLLSRGVEIVSGQTTREDLPAPPDAVPRVTTLDPTTSPPPRDAWRRTAWIATWVTAGLATLGAGALVVGELEARDYRANHCTAQMTASCSDTYNTGTRARTVGYVSLIAAGVAGLTATVLFLEAPPSRGESGAKVACVPTLLQVGAACLLRF